jgi:hypothetical protein
MQLVWRINPYMKQNANTQEVRNSRNSRAFRRLTLCALLRIVVYRPRPNRTHVNAE